MIRKGLSKKLRFDVFKRDEFTCCYCGQKPPSVVLEVDHVVPVVEGGSNEIGNLATSCFDCNRGKSGIPLDQLPRPVLELRQMMAEREEQERAYIKFVRARRKRQDALIEEIGEALFGDGYTFAKSSSAASARGFLERLPFDRVLFEAERAASKTDRDPRRAFKYFCGIYWKMISEAESR